MQSVELNNGIEEMEFEEGNSKELKLGAIF